MRYPAFLKKNGRIGIIAPSFGCADEHYAPLLDEAERKFREDGYEVAEGKCCRLSDGIGKSSTPLNCAGEINDFFMNDRCDVIISAGGGETMCEDLSFVDFEGIKNAPPKWFAGYSDNTNLTFTLPLLCDTAAVYASCATAFAMNPPHPSVSDTMSMLTGECLTAHNYDKWEIEDDALNEDPFAPYNLTEDFNMKIYSAGVPCEECGFSGRLLGGCLDILAVLCGTRFDKVREFNRRYEKDGVIWFLESCDLNPMSVRRVLWQLKNAGWFDCAKGFLIGRPLHYGEEMMGMDMTNAVTGILSDLDVPIIMDLDIGHLPPRMPLIEGAMAIVAAAETNLQIKMELS